MILRKRYCLLSTTAMIIVAVTGTYIMLTLPGYGLGGTLGLPFPWFWATDFTAPGRPSYGYYWWGLAADAAIWFTATIGIGTIIENVIDRRRNSAMDTNAEQAAPRNR